MKKLYLSSALNGLSKFTTKWTLLIIILMSAPILSITDVNAQPKRQTMSISVKNADLNQVLQLIKKETGYLILYNSTYARDIKGININKTNAPITDILNICLQNTSLSFSINDDTIIIQTKNTKTGDGNNDHAKQIVLTGKIINRATKTPLAGAMAYIKGTNIGAVADANGEYAMLLGNGKKEVTITFSFIGMENREVLYSGQKIIDIALLEKVESIDDVVVTGYGNVRKEGFTGNTTRITRDELVKVSPKSIISAIQVFDPSFRIADNIAMGSNPNALPEFYIRGQNAINPELSNNADISRQNLTNNPNLPIFILDGFEVSVEKIYDMDPSRVHSTTLLKDAAATALYGSRAANGVVVIESRAPEAGKLRISYNLTGSVEAPDLSAYNLMNASEKLQTEVDAGFYKYDPDLFENDIVVKLAQYNAKANNVKRGVNTDWLSKGLRTAVNHRHNLFIDGGENDVRWGVELKYNANNGVMKGSNRDTYGAGLFLDYRIGKFQIINRLSYDVMSSNDTPFQDFASYSHKQPYWTITDPVTGRYVPNLNPLNASTRSNVLINPLYEAEYYNSFSENNYNDLSNNFALNFHATSDLTIKTWLTLNKKYSKSTEFIDPASYVFNSVSPDNKGTLAISDGDYFAYDVNALVMYNKNINKNYINVTAGVNLRETNSVFKDSKYSGFASGSLHSINNAAQMDGKQVQTSNKTRLASMFLSANYTYDNIYLFDVSGRMDGSSEFGKKRKTAPFWATGVGINIHNYKFLSNSEIFSHLKIRGSYGQLGKVNFPIYAAQSSYTSTSINDWYLTGMGNMLIYLGNDNLTWEKTNTFDVGLEIGLLKDRIMLKTTYYNKLTVDMITDVTIPSSSGFKSFKDNLGKVVNRGIEVDIRYDMLRSKNLDVSIFANLSHNKNQIKEISSSLKAYNDLVNKQYDDYKGSDSKFGKTYTKYTEGGSTSSIYAVRSLGVNPGNGKEVYLKNDGTLTYQWEASDMVVVGNSMPKIQGSFGFNARYRNFSVFTSFMYHFGGQKYNSTLVNYVENVDLMSYNADKRVSTQRWKNSGDLTPLKDIADMGLITRPTSRFVQDDNVLQFNSISLSYDFDQKLIKKIGMGMLRLTASMQDISYWSHILQERGLSYPYSRTVNVTVNITF